MNHFRKLITFLAVVGFVLLGEVSYSQTTTAAPVRRPIQFSGLIYSSDSITELPFVTVAVKNRNSGTYSNIHGFFSLAVYQGDTILFRALGFKPATHVVSASDGEDAYSIVQQLEPNPIELKQVDIYPFTKAEFKDIFANTDVSDDALSRAQKNLSFNPYISNYPDAKIVASANANYVKEQNWRNAYYAGTQNGMIPGANGNLPIPTTLLSPAAWYNFIKSLKK